MKYKRLYKTKKVKAKRICQDDLLKIAGQLYRVADMEENKSEDVIAIWCYQVQPLAPISTTMRMTVDRNTKFKVYYL